MDLNAHLQRKAAQQNAAQQIEIALMRPETLDWYTGLDSDEHQQIVRDVLQKALNQTQEDTYAPAHGEGDAEAHDLARSNALSVQDELILRMASSCTAYELALISAQRTLGRLHNN